MYLTSLYRLQGVPLLGVSNKGELGKQAIFKLNAKKIQIEIIL